MLADYDVDPIVRRIVLYHHSFNPIVLERIEPARDNIIFERSRALHTIDAFVALTSYRPYRRAYSAEEAFAIIGREHGHDPDVIGFLKRAEAEKK
jgi:hypothetical protein